MNYPVLIDIFIFFSPPRVKFKLWIVNSSCWKDELQRSESKLADTSNELSTASTRADDINRAIKILENKNMIDEGRVDMLESQVKEAKQMVEESDIKYDEVARKLAMVEGDLERAGRTGGSRRIQDCWFGRRITRYRRKSQKLGSRRGKGAATRGRIQKADSTINGSIEDGGKSGGIRGENGAKVEFADR